MRYELQLSLQAQLGQKPKAGFAEAGLRNPFEHKTHTCMFAPVLVWHPVRLAHEGS